MSVVVHLLKELNLMSSLIMPKPLVHQLVLEFFGNMDNNFADVDIVISMGLCLQGGVRWLFLQK